MKGNKCYVSRIWMPKSMSKSGVRRRSDFKRGIMVFCERESTARHVRDTLYGMTTPLILSNISKQPSGDWGIYITPITDNYRYALDGVKSAVEEITHQRVEEI